jgi:hypothetical protein
MNNKVSIGSTTIVGWLSALLALFPTIIKAVETGSVALAGPEKYLAIGGIIVGAITQIGRYLQAHKLISLNVNKVAEELSHGFEQGPLESAIKPDVSGNIIANNPVPISTAQTGV